MKVTEWIAMLIQFPLSPFTKNWTKIKHTGRIRIDSEQNYSLLKPKPCIMRRSEFI